MVKDGAGNLSEIRVDAMFGETAVDEGSMCSLVSGGPFVKGMEVKK